MDNNTYISAVTNKLNSLFPATSNNEAWKIISTLPSTNIKQAVIELSDGNLQWLEIYAKLAMNKEHEVLNAYQKRMLEKKHENDIRVGANKVISWIHFEPNENNVRSIDTILEPLEHHFKKLEINCDPLCCGVKAFSFAREDILSLIDQDEQEEFRKSIKRVKREIEGIDTEVVLSTVLNQLFNKHVFIDLLSHIENIEK